MESDKLRNGTTDGATDLNNKDEQDLVKLEFEKKEETPDGGWGWFVVLGNVVTLIITGGIQRSGGVLFLRFDERFQKSASATSWVLSLSSSFQMMSGPIASALSNRFSMRSVAIFGGFLFAAGVMVSGFAPNLEFLYFSYGLISGFGRSCAYTPPMVLVGLYFNKRRGLAVGLSSAGIGVGSFVVPPLIDFLFSYYGFTGAFIVMSGVILNSVVCGCLYRSLSLQRKLMSYDRRKKLRNTFDIQYTSIPLQEMNNEHKEISLPFTEDGMKNHDKTNLEDKEHDHESNNCNHTTSNSIEDNRNAEITISPLTRLRNLLIPCKKNNTNSKTSDRPKKKFLELSLLKDYRFFSFGIAIMLYTLAFRIIQVFLPAYAKQRGLSDTEGAYLLSIGGIVDTFSRVIAGTVLDLKRVKPYRIIIYNFIMYFVCAICFIIPSLDTFLQLSVLSGFLGCVTGAYLSQKSIIIIDILGAEKLTSSFGLTLCFQGIGSLIGPPISGIMRDNFGSWAEGFYVGGAGVFLGATVLSISNIVHYIKNRKSQSSIM